MHVKIQRYNFFSIYTTPIRTFFTISSTPIPAPFHRPQSTAHHHTYSPPPFNHPSTILRPSFNHYIWSKDGRTMVKRWSKYRGKDGGKTGELPPETDVVSD